MNRQPPYDLDAEVAVLGGSMLDSKAGYTILGLIEPENFYLSRNQIIWRLIVEFLRAGKAVDALTLTAAVKDRGLANDIGGESALFEIQYNAVGSSNIESYAQRIRDTAQRRRVIAFAQSLQDSAYTHKGDELAAEAGVKLQTLLAHSTGHSKKLSQTFADVDKTLSLARQRRAEGGILGVPTGLPELDKMTGGLHGPRLIILAARPGSGKSAMMNQIAFHGALRGHGGLICSIEMGADELVIRAMASAGRVNVSKISRGFPEEGRIGSDAIGTYGDLPLWFDDESNRLDAICAQIVMHKHRHNIAWAAVDHLGLVSTEKFATRNDQIGHITWTLKQLAKRLNIPIIALCQLSRNGEKEGRHPGLHDLRDSGNVEQDADICIFLHTNPKERGLPIKPLEIGVLKNRAGPCAWIDKQFMFDGQTQRIEEVMREAQSHHTSDREAA